MYKETGSQCFISLYSKLYRENFEELEKLRKKRKRVSLLIMLIVMIFLLFTFLIVLVFAGIYKYTFIFMLIIIPVIILIVIFSLVNKFKYMNKETMNENRSYEDVFKEKVILPLIQESIPDSQYFINNGLSTSEYQDGNWEYFDIYKSEDKIISKINISGFSSDLVISEVHTKIRSEDSDGHTTYTTIFQGLAGYTNLPKSIGCCIKVIKKRIKILKYKNIIEMDMSEFEKIFDVVTDDRIKAMQILTSDVMSDLIQMVDEIGVQFEFYINNDIMHIRFHTGPVFEPSVFESSMQLKQLKKYCDIVKNVINVTEHISSAVIELDL